MNTKEIRKLIDLEQFYADVENIVGTCNCTYLDAVEEYGHRNDIDDDTLGQIVRASRGKFKANLQAQCESLLLTKP